MKLYVKDKYFQWIKKGMKNEDYRDAHITFINEDTNEILIKNIASATVIDRPKDLFSDVLHDDRAIIFFLEDP